MELAAVGTVAFRDVFATSSHSSLSFLRRDTGEHALGGSKGRRKLQNGENEMLGVLLLLLLLVLLFGGLGVFVAKVFLAAMLIAIVLSVISGGMFLGRRGRRV